MDAIAIAAAERARRGIHLPKATGCPCTAPVQRVVEKAKTVRSSEANRERTLARYRKWRAMYEEQRMSVTEIAAAEGVKAFTVSRGLGKLGVAMRPKGFGEIVARLKRENAALRGRLASYRHRLKKYEQEAA